MDQDHQLEQAPREVLLDLGRKKRRNVLSEVRKDLLCDRQKLLLNLEKIREVVDDGVGRQQMSPRLIQEGRDCAHAVSSQLRHGEIDDAASLREAVADFLEQFE